MRNFVWIAVSCGALLVPTEARAEVAVDDYNPQTTFRPQEFPWESGFLPSGGPLQINLMAAAYQEVDIEMYGDGEYDFDALALSFEGQTNSGVFENALGIELTAVVGIHVLGIDTEFEVGIYTIEEEANAEFTPYVLPGAPVRPIVVSEAIGPNNLVNEDFLIPGFDIPGNLNIDYTVNIPGNEYSSVRIDLNDANNKSAAPVMVGQYDQENENLDLVLPGALPGELAYLYATLYGTFDSAISIVFDVTVTVEVLSVPFEIGPFQIVLDYPVAEDLEIVFGEEELMFQVPEAPDPPATSTTGDSADDSSGAPDEETGDSASDSDTTTGQPPAETGEPPPDVPTTGGIPPDSVGDTSPGCGCTSGAPTPIWAMIGLFGLAAVRRRRTPS